MAEYRVLARKYRPSSFADLEGQDILAQTLTHAINTNRIPQAFLLHGIRGVGKTTTARIIARCLNCVGPDGNGSATSAPCGVCQSCVSISEDRHLDILEIDAASRTGVDDIREIIDSSRYKAVMGRYKIFIIDEVHMLSKSAFNALLKTLEEPPTHVKFIFATTEIRKIPDTILSRCMRFDLKRMENNTIVNQLEKISSLEGFTLEHEAAGALARAADGSMRDGLSMLDQAMALSQTDGLKAITFALVSEMLGLSDRTTLLKLIKALFEGEVETAVETLRSLISLGADPLLVIQDILDNLYNIICLKTLPRLSSDGTFSPSELDEYRVISGGLSVGVLMRAWQMLLNGYKEIQNAYKPAQALEMVLVRLCYVKDLPTPGNSTNNSTASNAPHTSSSNQQSSPASFTPSVNSSDNSKAEAPEQSKNSAPLPTNLQQLVDLLNEHKEPMVASHVFYDAKLVSLQGTYLKLNLNDSAPKGFDKTLGTILQRITGQSWNIETVEDAAGPSLAETHAKRREDYQLSIREHPVVKEIFANYPNSSIQFYNEEHPSEYQ